MRSGDLRLQIVATRRELFDLPASDATLASSAAADVAT